MDTENTYWILGVRNSKSGQVNIGVASRDHTIDLPRTPSLE